jgi:hypothetical protein
LRLGQPANRIDPIRDGGRGHRIAPREYGASAGTRVLPEWFEKYLSE